MSYATTTPSFVEMRVIVSEDSSEMVRRHLEIYLDSQFCYVRVYL